VDDTRRQRLADNESAFREINERIDERVERWQQLEQAYERVVCECSDSQCAERIPVTPAEHRMARRHTGWFLIARKHDNADLERVVYRTERFWIVEKQVDATV
jgi:hypothetical protein